MEPTATPGQIAAVQSIAQNLELFRITFNVLQQLMKEHVDKKTGCSYADASIISSTAKMVLERWEYEKRKLPSSRLEEVCCSKEFLHAKFEITPEMQREIVDEIGKCTWFKQTWPGVERIKSKK